MEKLLLANTILALLGAYYVSSGKSLGFFIWIFTNIFFMIHNYMIGQWQQGLLFTAYFGLAIYGFLNLLKKENFAKPEEK